MLELADARGGGGHGSWPRRVPRPAAVRSRLCHDAGWTQERHGFRWSRAFRELRRRENQAEEVKKDRVTRRALHGAVAAIVAAAAVRAFVLLGRALGGPPCYRGSMLAGEAFVFRPDGSRLDPLPLALVESMPNAWVIKYTPRPVPVSGFAWGRMPASAGRDQLAAAVLVDYTGGERINGFLFGEFAALFSKFEAGQGWSLPLEANRPGPRRLSGSGPRPPSQPRSDQGLRLALPAHLRRISAAPRSSEPPSSSGNGGTVTLCRPPPVSRGATRAAPPWRKRKRRNDTTSPCYHRFSSDSASIVVSFVTF